MPAKIYEKVKSSPLPLSSSFSCSLFLWPLTATHTPQLVLNDLSLSLPPSSVSFISSLSVFCSPCQHDLIVFDFAVGQNSLKLSLSNSCHHSILYTALFLSLVVRALSLTLLPLFDSFLSFPVISPYFFSIHPSILFFPPSPAAAM